MIRALFAVLVAYVALVVAPRPALAQRGPDRIDVNASVEPTTVEIGATFRYQLRAQVNGPSGDAPRSSQPGNLPAGLQVVGTSNNPMRLSVNMNGVPSTVSSLTTVWTVRASKLGTFTLGPATVEIGGQIHRARAVKVTVVEKGKAPRPQQSPDPFDAFFGTPFDFFNQAPDPSGGAPFDPFRDLMRDDDRLRASADPKLALDEPRAPTAFLHAVVDKPRAVVGEQVTQTVYLYSLPEAQLGRALDVHVPAVPDFTRQPLMDDSTPKNLGRAVVGDRLWDVQLVLQDALFPLKTGKLSIGPLTFVLTNRRVGYRESQALTVDVSEPPLAGRPPGYAVGDVGDFSLQAQVNPRKAVRGESVGVQIELRGTGNLPSQLALPTAPGIEWMDAQTRESIGVQRQNRIGGTRTFTYVVRIDKEGPVDLGAIELPYYDPDRRAYGVARAALGIVDVAPGAPRPDAGAPDVRDEEAALADLPAPRAALEGRAETTYLTERRGFFASVLGAPFACAAAVVLGRLAQTARERRKARAPDPARVARERRAEVDQALSGDDGGKAIAAIVRAVEADVLARTGVNVRGTTGAQLTRELEGAGAAEDAATSITNVLRECEDARFSPAGVSIEAARELWTKATTALDRLARGRDT